MEKLNENRYDGAKEIDSEEEFENKLPDHPNTLFEMRSHFIKAMDELSNVDREVWRILQNRVHAMNRKLNELGIPEHGEKVVEQKEQERED